MRQAGRYLPEYRALRREVSGFLALCFDPARASAVTLQPVERFDLDAAILFSDILVIPHALGRRVDFVEGEGPQLDPIASAEIGSLRISGVTERLAPVLETLALVRAQAFPGKVSDRVLRGAVDGRDLHDRGSRDSGSGAGTGVGESRAAGP